MTPEELIAEGRKLARPSVLLKPHGTGPIVARWYECDRAEIREWGERCWLTVDCGAIPNLSMTGYLRFYTNQINYQSGRVEHLTAWPQREGLPLIAHSAMLLPPIEVVFRRGSDVVAAWLSANNWKREWSYNPNFKERAVADAYVSQWMKECPLYANSDMAYAVLGGWHLPWPDGDWDDLMDEQLLLTTFEDYEPWLEAWKMRDGTFRVIQRIT